MRMDSHCFGFLCVKEIEPWCAHCIIDEWVALEREMLHLTFQDGLLFPRLNYDGTVNHGKRWRAKDISDSLERDLKRYHLYEGETPHSFRHGGTVDSLKKGKNLEKTMCLAYMKSTSTAKIYSKGITHLFPAGFDWKEAGVSRSPVSLSQVTYFTKSFHRVIHLFHLPKKPISPRFTCFFCNSLRPISQYFTAMQTYFTTYVTMIPTFKDTFFV